MKQSPQHLYSKHFAPIPISSDPTPKKPRTSPRPFTQTVSEPFPARPATQTTLKRPDYGSHIAAIAVLAPELTDKSTPSRPSSSNGEPAPLLRYGTERLHPRRSQPHLALPVPSTIPASGILAPQIRPTHSTH